MPSWIAPEMDGLFARYVDPDWMMKQDDRHIWERLADLPEEQLWQCHQQLKRKLFGAIQQRMRDRWVEENVPASQMAVMGCLLDPEALTIGYARRFVEYKRPALLFRDQERLKRILTNPWQPVQVVLAGKSHPADFPSKHLLHHGVNMASDRAYQGRIAVLEDYDMHLARYLVQGVDVWLNSPRRLQEASGTSGMKAAINGVLNLSVLDGWWHEGFNGSNGWALGNDVSAPLPEQEDEADAAELYRLLEEKVVPLYYGRDRAGVPRGWIRMVESQNVLRAQVASTGKEIPGRSPRAAR